MGVCAKHGRVYRPACERCERVPRTRVDPRQVVLKRPDCRSRRPGAVERTRGGRRGMTMLSGLVSFALKQRLFVILGGIALVIWGASAYQKLPIDAFPDISPIQVLVSMRASGLTPEELESRV